MMFVYKNGVTYNGMGIKGTLKELYEEAERISAEIFKEDRKAEVRTKITFWD
jgi:hypothetical protein